MLNTPFLRENVWSKVLPLTNGLYRYKFIVDGEWILDPDNTHREINEFGGENCVVVVAQEGCEV